MSLAVILSETEIVTIESTASAASAAAKADRARQISGRTFKAVDRHNLSAEYGVYLLDSSDERLLADPDRHNDPKYVGYVLTNCKHVASFAGQR